MDEEKGVITDSTYRHYDAKAAKEDEEYSRRKVEAATKREQERLDRAYAKYMARKAKRREIAKNAKAHAKEFKRSTEGILKKGWNKFIGMFSGHTR